MKLFGHDTSPYVRRVRALLHELGIPFERDKTDWVTPSQDFLHASPIGRVPVLVVQQNGKGLPLLDSRIIAEFVLTHSPARPRSSEAQPPFHAVLFDPLHRYQDENMLAAIDAALDSAIAVFIFERDGLPRASAPYLKRQDARIATCLKWIDDTYGKRATLHDSGFSYLDLALMSSLDWLTFRNVYDFSAHKNLAYFYEQNRSRASMVATDPRLA